MEAATLTSQSHLWPWTWIDYLCLVVVFASAVISALRGFMREVVSLATWVLAIWLAVTCSQEVSHWWVGVIETPSLRLLASLFVLLVCGLLGGAVIGWALTYVLRKGGLTYLDRVIGVVFGLARGLVLAALLVLAIRQAPIEHDHWWQDAKVVPMLMPASDWLGRELPLFMHRMTQKMLGEPVSHEAQELLHASPGGKALALKPELSWWQRATGRMKPHGVQSS